MPTRTKYRLPVLAAMICAASLAQAQDPPGSSYRLRSERGYGQQLHVEAEAEPTPAKVAASLSDDESQSEPSEQATSDPGVAAEPVESQPVGDLQVGTIPQRTRTRSPGSLSPGNRPNTFVRSPMSARSSDASPAPAGRQPLKLAPRSESSGRQLAKPAALGTGALGTVGGALAVVLGLFVIVVWITRRVGPSGNTPLPKEAVELLGRTTISGQHALQLVRVGSRLVLVALSSHGAATLTEITDPAEVERLTAICLRQRPGSSTASFAQTVAQLERESTGRSFVDQRRPGASASTGRSRSVARA